MKTSLIKHLFIYSLLFVSCASSTRHSFVFHPGLEGSMPTIEGIDYPSLRLNSVDKSYCVNIYLANLFYGTKYGSNDIALIHKYGGLKGITIALVSSEEILSFYDVDLNEYSKQENGIIWNNANKAKIKDFSLCYPFDLQTIFKGETKSLISFKIIYSSETEVSDLERGKSITFNLVKTQSFIEISAFDYSYINKETQL